jgi:predicted site-specific integrase-resolvase
MTAPGLRTPDTPAPQLTDRWITKRETAELLHIKPRTLEAWEKRGLVKPIRPTKRSPRYRLSEIIALIQSAA